MIRYIFISTLICILGLACTRPEERSARYDKNACPICSHITDGTCSYCDGTGKCMYCNGTKKRTIKGHNRIERSGLKPFSHTETCPFCKGTGVCHYCGGKKKCWACNGTTEVEETWQCLNKR